MLCRNTLKFISDFPLIKISINASILLSYVQWTALLSDWVCESESVTSVSLSSCDNLWTMKNSVAKIASLSSVADTYNALPYIMLVVTLYSSFFTYIVNRDYIRDESNKAYFVGISQLMLLFFNVIVLSLFYDKLKVIKTQLPLIKWDNDYSFGSIGCILLCCIYGAFFLIWLVILNKNKFDSGGRGVYSPL